MGREVVQAVLAAPDMALTLAIDTMHAGADAGVIAGTDSCGIVIAPWPATDTLGDSADVLVDFTTPASAAENALRAIAAGVSPVVGTTGISTDDLQRLEAEASRRSIGAVIAPNFAIGAVLMMHFAEMAARHMPDCEIIELHHPMKLDAPSGTAKLTAARIERARAEGSGQAVPIHSVRLPGLVAHQEVIFGAAGQTLSIRHDSMDRKSFMPGVLLAIRKVRALSGLVVGLDALLNL
jgi:4-hydroxy-tetrahydrodipicolinate reductase